MYGGTTTVLAVAQEVFVVGAIFYALVPGMLLNIACPFCPPLTPTLGQGCLPSALVHSALGGALSAAVVAAMQATTPTAAKVSTASAVLGALSFAFQPGVLLLIGCGGNIVSLSNFAAVCAEAVLQHTILYAVVAYGALKLALSTPPYLTLPPPW